MRVFVEEADSCCALEFQGRPWREVSDGGEDGPPCDTTKCDIENGFWRRRIIEGGGRRAGRRAGSHPVRVGRRYDERFWQGRPAGGEGTHRSLAASAECGMWPTTYRSMEASPQVCITALPK